MVEKQRDLLLQAVQKLSQRSQGTSSPEINSLLQELRIPQDLSENVLSSQTNSESFDFTMAEIFASTSTDPVDFFQENESMAQPIPNFSHRPFPSNTREPSLNTPEPLNNTFTEPFAQTIDFADAIKIPTDPSNAMRTDQLSNSGSEGDLTSQYGILDELFSTANANSFPDSMQLLTHWEDPSHNTQVGLGAKTELSNFSSFEVQQQYWQQGTVTHLESMFTNEV